MLVLLGLVVWALVTRAWGIWALGAVVVACLGVWVARRRPRS
ncbi:MAG TPA: hypothetical protein VHC70_14850 [Phycisphaerales bacterium]|nr:hypothetical protein [Phycisphaerales bacterium]